MSIHHRHHHHGERLIALVRTRTVLVQVPVQVLLLHACLPCCASGEDVFVFLSWLNIRQIDRQADR